MSKKSRIMHKIMTQATLIAQDRDKMRELVDNVESKKENKKVPVAKQLWNEFLEKVSLFVQLLKSYKKGEYRIIPAKSILLIIASLIYFLTPFDFVPDFLVFAGLMDDISIVFWVANSISADLADYQKFLNSKAQTIEVSS